ncbi:NAD(P)-dependent oxidoreductase [Streptomyces sp. NPDC054804]
MGVGKLVLATGSGLVTDEACAYIRGRHHDVRRVTDDHLDADGLHEALDGVAGYLIGGYEEPGDEHFARHPALEAVAWLGSDYRPFVPGWRSGHERGIAFITSPGTNADAVAEFTLLLCMTMAHPFVGSVVQPGAAVPALPASGRECAGRRMGIIGLGRIGRRVARMARAGLGMDVSYFSPRRDSALERSLGLTFRAKADLLASSDVVTLHRPGPHAGEAPELTAADLALLPHGSLLVNTVHPRLVDLTALLAAVRDRGIRAAFDGVSAGTEWDRLTGLGPDRFLAVPQMGFNTREANARAAMATARAVCDVLDGREPPSVDNPDFRSVRRRSGRP